jgi:SAM-dependent methyltransferase
MKLAKGRWQLYTRSAQLYDDMYHFLDYRRATSELMQLVRQLRPEARTLLDVGCGTGQHLSHLKDQIRVEGLDISEDLLAIARERLPGVVFHQGDMIDFDLRKTFDVVICLFGSITYVRTRANLDRAVSCLSRHVSPGGLLVIEPWLSPEQYWRNHIKMNIADQPERKIVWMYVGQEQDNIVTNDYHFMVATPEGVSHFTEQHTMGLFSEADYVESLAAAGMTLLREHPSGFFGYGLYVASRS